MSQSAQNNHEANDAENMPKGDLHERILGKSISPTTYLATDYLNHFNEVIMLFDMITDMPDLLDELYEWMPKTYTDHFKDSGLSDQDLIIEAYHAASAEDRDTLLSITKEMEMLIKSTVAATRTEDGPLDEISLSVLCTTTTEKLRERINLASGVINSGAASVAIHHSEALTHTSINDTQATVDILFD